MTSLAAALKEDVGTLARREVRRHTASADKAAARCARDIAALKREVQALCCIVGHVAARACRCAEEDARSRVARSTASEEGGCDVRVCQAVDAESILRRSVEGASRAPRAVCRELRQASRRLGAVDLQLGAGRGPSAQEQRRRLDRHPANRQARSRQTTGEPQGCRAEIGVHAETGREVVAEHRPLSHAVAFPANGTAQASDRSRPVSSFTAEVTMARACSSVVSSRIDGLPDGPRPDRAVRTS